MILYSIVDNKKIELSSGHLADVITECHVIVSYSLDGWLMYMDKVCEPQCVNLVTGERIYLPSITTIPDIKGVRTDDKGHTIGYYSEGPGDPDDNDFVSCETMHWFYKLGIIISAEDLLPAQVSNHSDRPTGQGYKIVVVNNIMSMIAFARQGDSSWTIGDRACKGISSFILHKGSLYMASTCGIRIFYFDISCDLSFHSAIALPANFRYLEQKTGCSASYLVEVDGHLWIIWRNLKLTKEYRTYAHLIEDSDDDHFYTPTTVSFQVFKFDENQTTWVEIDNLGGFAIFVGRNYSMALSTTDFPYLPRDCIYFTDDHIINYL